MSCASVLGAADPNYDMGDPHSLPSVKTYNKQQCYDRPYSEQNNYYYGADEGQLCANNKPGPMSPLSNSLLTQGILPLYGRAPLTPLYPEPLEGEYFKPPKNAVDNIDFQDPFRPQQDVHGAKHITGRVREYADFASRTNGPSGALDNYYPKALCEKTGNDNPDGDGEITTQRGFANGLYQTGRYWGFHQTLRPFYGVPSTKTQLKFNMPGTPRAYGVKGSIHGEGRTELGALRTPFNSFVKEKQHRVPMPTSGRTTNRVRGDPKPVLNCSNRSSTTVEWFGPRGVARGVEAPDNRLLTLSEILKRAARNGKSTCQVSCTQ